MGVKNINVAVGGHQSGDYPKVYNTVYIKPNIPFALQVTEPNTKYVIRHKIDLGGKGDAVSDVDFTNAGTHEIAGVEYYYVPFTANGKPYTLLDDSCVFITSDWTGLSERTITPDEGTVFMIASMTGGLHTGAYINAEVVTMPENCILEFDGGSLDNGVIVGQDTVFINVGDVEIWGKNLIRLGTWREHSGGGGESHDVDRPYDPTNFVGMGKDYIDKNIVLIDGVEKNILTQGMINQTHTIYVIQYDFDLNGADITVPEHCAVWFDGGSLNNGTFRFNSATVEGEPKGTALYGVAYKDEQPLLHNYNRYNALSSTYDMAYFNFRGSVLHTRMSTQSLCVTSDYVIVVGNEDINENNGLVVVFDRKFNLLGQVKVPDFGHGNGCTTADGILYVATGWSVVSLSIQTIINACDGATIHTIDSVTQVYDDFAIHAIDYDPNREEFALFYKEQVVEGDYAHCFLMICDKNFDVKQKFNVDLNDYVTKNFAGSYNGLDTQNTHKGTFGDIAYRNGVVITPFWYMYNYAIDVVENSAFIEIDANNGTPVSYLGRYIDKSSQTECEGICFDPDNENEFWVNEHAFYNVIGIERHAATYIGRVSFSENVTGIVLPYGNNKVVNSFGKGANYIVHVDNSWTDFSTGNNDAPFKTLETAMLLTTGNQPTKFLIKGSDKLYTINGVGVGSHMTFEGIKVNDAKPVINFGRFKVYDGILEAKDVVFTLATDKESAIIEAGMGGVVRLTDVDFALNPDVEHISSYGGFGIQLYDGADLSLWGTVSFTGISIPIDFYGGGNLTHVGTISLRYCDRCYRLQEPGFIVDGAISCIQADETITRLYTVSDYSKSFAVFEERIPAFTFANIGEFEVYAKNLMSKCMNNPNIVTFCTAGDPGVPYGKYIYSPTGLRRTTDNFLDKYDSHENLLYGTAYFDIDTTSGDVYNVKSWRKVGSNPVPAVIDVTVPVYNKVKKGLSFTGISQTACKDFMAPNGDGWYAFSLLVKGTGQLRMYIDIYHPGQQAQDTFDRYVDVNSPNNWIPLTYIIYAANVDTARSQAAKLKLNSEGSLIVAAMKVEAAGSASDWTCHPDEFPTGGNTSNRPSGTPIGYQYFDSDLNKVIVSKGDNTWVNVDGTPLT